MGAAQLERSRRHNKLATIAGQVWRRTGRLCRGDHAADEFCECSAQLRRRRAKRVHQRLQQRLRAARDVQGVELLEHELLQALWCVALIAVRWRRRVVGVRDEAFQQERGHGLLQRRRRQEDMHERGCAWFALHMYVRALMLAPVHDRWVHSVGSRGTRRDQPALSRVPSWGVQHMEHCTVDMRRVLTGSSSHVWPSHRETCCTQGVCAGQHLGQVLLDGCGSGRAAQELPTNLGGQLERIIDHPVRFVAPWWHAAARLDLCTPVHR